MNTTWKLLLAGLVLGAGLSHCLAQFTTCGETNLPGNYVTYVTVPNQTDARITGKNSQQFACLATNGPWRNQLVVFLPGTGGVPRTFENFVQNAANLGFHALALTYENDTSLASFCAADTDPDCYFKLRYEFLTGSNTTSKAVVTRPNSIEFRLAAFLHWLNTNHPAENWGRFSPRPIRRGPTRWPGTNFCSPATPRAAAMRVSLASSTKSSAW